MGIGEIIGDQESETFLALILSLMILSVLQLLTLNF